jgi:hypothetical protein
MIISFSYRHDEELQIALHCPLFYGQVSGHKTLRNCSKINYLQRLLMVLGRDKLSHVFRDSGVNDANSIEPKAGQAETCGRR